jgi:hypothetical protein
MTQPTRQHRREIWASLCIGYDTVSDILWRAALDGGQAGRSRHTLSTNPSTGEG